MPAILLRNELTARVISGGNTSVVTVNRMLATPWVMEDGAPSDAFFAFLILDENGAPIMDVNGRYLIGG